MTTEQALNLGLPRNSLDRLVCAASLTIAGTSDLAEGAINALELRFPRRVERPPGLLRGVRNRRAGYGADWQDVRYDDYALVIELDRRPSHDGVQAFRDMDRDNVGVLAGQATVRYGWFDVSERPCPMAFQIGHALIQRGLDGPAPTL